MKIILTISLLLLCAFCRSGDNLTILNNKIDLIKFDCWLNLMLGGKPSFHYAGEIKVDTLLINKFSFREVVILNNQKTIHKSKPILEKINIENQSEIYTGNFIFLSPYGIEVNEEMMKVNTINVLIKFVIDKKEIPIMLNDIELIRAY
jgi:hypothetical protein